MRAAPRYRGRSSPTWDLLPHAPHLGILGFGASLSNTKKMPATDTTLNFLVATLKKVETGEINLIMHVI